jgi:Ran GTPase-activating protein (RanGAP) involved in mRNA processing and transport
MTNLDMPDNDFYGTEAGEALGDMLAVNTVLKQLNLSNCNMRIKSIKAFAVGIRDNGALSSLNLANNNIGVLIEEDGWTAVSTDTYEQGQIVEGNYKQYEKWYPGKITDVTDGTYSITYDDGDAESNVAAAFIKSPEEDKEIQWQHTDGRQQDSKPAKAALGVIALANAIPDMGAISSINLLKNEIPVKQAQELVRIMQAKDNLTTLCGLSREEKELDFSSQNLGAGDAVLIANDISDMWALSNVDISKNSLCASGVKVLCEALRGNKVITELNIEGNYLGKTSPSLDAPADMTGVDALADAISNMGVLSKLNVAKNLMSGCGMQILAVAISNTMALNSLNLNQNGLLNKESGHALALALSANSVLTELDVSKNFDLANSSSQDGSGFAESFANCLSTNKSLKTVDISNNNIPFSDGLFTSMCAISRVLAEGNNFTSIINPCLKILCERKVLEVESIGKVDLHSEKLTGQVLAAF